MILGGHLANAGSSAASKNCFYTGFGGRPAGSRVIMRNGIKLGLLLAVLGCSLHGFAGDLRITLPKRSKPTPVQQLNREGVKELQKHHVNRAKRIFYKAYLLDPDDPFTLNNLGYISELEGDADRALKYYELSSKNTSQALIDQASRPDLKGRPLQEAFASLQVPELRSNKANVQAISLLGKGRVAEAEAVLKKALANDPNNAFTLNNMGYVMESEGDLQSALRYYSQAASLRTTDTVLVAPNPKWRGKAIADVASQNARAVNEAIAKGEDKNAQVARLNLRGVAALNHNDPAEARKFFEQAYKLDPQNAFSLNNMGYVSEMDGDRETAESYYQEARAALGSNQPVTYASSSRAEGRRMGDVAQDNEVDVDSRIEAIREIRQREGGPIQLKRRDNSVVIEPENPPQAPPLEGITPPPLPAPQLPERMGQQPQPGTQPQNQQQPQLLEPLPESQQPPAAQTPQSRQSQTQPENPKQPGLLEPLPESQQPPAARTPQGAGQQPSQVQPQNQQQPQLLEPLPESQQPPAARTPQSNAPQAATPQAPPSQTQPQNQNQQQPQLLEPLPESQQPPSARTPQQPQQTPQPQE